MKSRDSSFPCALPVDVYTNLDIQSACIVLYQYQYLMNQCGQQLKLV